MAICHRVHAVAGQEKNTPGMEPVAVTITRNSAATSTVMAVSTARTWLLAHEVIRVIQCMPFTLASGGHRGHHARG